MPPRVVADSNVLISALYRGGTAQRVLELAEEGAIELCLSPFILDEVAGVLRLKFSWPPAQILEALAALRFTLVDPGPPHLAILRDVPDNRILECAGTARAKYLVTGDADLLALKRCRRTMILPLRAFHALFPR